MIELKHVSKEYQGNFVLQDLSLTVHKGDFVFLQGESGSGKSTLLKILYRDVEDFQGEIWIEGRPAHKIPKFEVRRKIGVVFQSFELLEGKTVLENVALAGEILGKKEDDIQKDAKRILEQVGLRGKEHIFPHALSGGEQQRVAIARALLNQPKILLADEPTGNLDSKTAHNIMEILTELNKKEGVAILMVTHSNELIRAFPARVLTMNKGKVEQYEQHI